MKSLTKFFSALFSLILVLAPAVASADVDTTPAQTTVAIHKLISKDGKTIENLNGSSLTNEQLKEKLGDVEPMKGVKFQWFKVKDTDTVENLKTKTLDELKAAYTTTGITSATDETGTTTFTVNKADYGLYWVVELAKDGSEASKEMQVTSTVPMLITLPFGTESGYLDTVNVYPKNKVETPTPGKDVSTLGNNDSGTKVGDTVNVNFTLNTYLNHRDNLIEEIVDSISKENIKMFGGQKFLDLPFEEQQHYSCQQLCEWRWLPDECGNILRVNEVPGQDPSYSATLVKYAVVLDKNRDEV